MKTTARISVFVLLLFVVLFSGVTLATEKSVSCPTKFDPDDSMWAMHKIDIVEKGLYRIHERVFSYFPDPEKRILVGIKKMWNPDCVAALVSYGSSDPDADGKRVWGMIVSPNGEQYYLFLNGAWEQGDDIGNALSCDDTKNFCSIKFILYKEKSPIASLVVVIKGQ